MKQLSRIFLTAQNVNIKKTLKMTVSKSAKEKGQEKRIGRLRKLSRYKDVILSNDTIKGPVERRLFSQGTMEL